MRINVTYFVLTTYLVIIACGCDNYVFDNNQSVSDEVRLQTIEKMCLKYDNVLPSVPNVSATELANLTESENIIVLDTRPEKERSVSYIPGSLSEDEFKRDRDSYRNSKIIAYCTIGYRSAIAADKLRAEGFDMHNLRGGILAWTHSAQKVIDKNGETRKVHVYGKKWNLLPKAYTPVW